MRRDFGTTVPPMPDIPLRDLDDDHPLTTDEVAAYLRATQDQVEKWRARSPYTGPPYFRLGDQPRSPCRYPAGQLRAWMHARSVNTEQRSA